MSTIKKPFSVEWELTLKCNGQCIYCGSNAEKQLSGELNFDESLKLIKQFSQLGVKVVNILGGEVFLKENWFEILKEIKNNGMEIFIITNGTLFTPEIIKKLKVIDPLNISVSLDGDEKHHNKVRRGAKFKTVLKNIDWLIKEKFNVGIISTIIKQNYSFSSLENLHQILQKRDIFSWRIQPGYFEGRMKEEFLLSPEEIYKLCQWISQKNKENFSICVGDSMGYFSKADQHLRINPWFGCTAGLTHFSVSYKGDIKGCLALLPKYTEGNIKKDNLITIWNSPKSFSYNRHFKTSLLKGKCKNCKHNQICRGGCRAFNSCINGFFENKYCNLILENDQKNSRN